MTDDQLAELALAADPETPVDDDAVSIWELSGLPRDERLPEWYMPAPIGGPGGVRGWRRRVVAPIVGSMLLITAAGLCNTYGQLQFG